MSQAARSLNTRAVTAAVIGNALEWYDFTVFGFLTVVIAELFFPSSSDYASILLTTASFGVAFFMRPIGGIVLGLYADRAGRKAALSLVIALMTLGILLLAIAPPYSAIGIGAPIIIVVGRLLQGFSAGGEFGSSTALLIEAAPFSKRGLYGSWQMASQAAALLLGAIVGALVTRGLSPEALKSWGWRVPFIIGLVIGPIGFYIRRNLADSEAFLHAKQTARRATLGELFAHHTRDVLCGLGSVIALTVTIYVLISYLPTFAVKQLKLPYSDSFTAVIVGNLLIMVLSPLTGAWSDRIGRKGLSLWSLGLTLVVIYPLFAWLEEAPSVSKLILVQAVLSITLSGYYGPFGALMAELFPANVRSTGLSLAYNFAVMLFGGFGQFIVTWLIKTTGSPLAPTYYVMFGITLSMIAVACMPAKRHADLDAMRKPVDALERR
ncbi:MFS transporter [Paraburkholderia hospita]|jgi:MFS family permease|uniref:General substrate transporter n=1 Tax=Paraburkholderia hospita TaxID=169430 RepID=A0ABP2PRH6_9BURK|nr:MFS transporter [Paraburkholderia hospita]EUC21503.1 General substrate transporter [Burkholderia sp. BT03]SKC66925.1 Predicted arabinose efflux permease, MFS family [Burkholderia sp. CF099]EIN00372.1 general substrate transporter [Paraburkholderia hospita]OUL88385.1 MFS transporter [Paraburkholderia hospita]SKC49834.1 Predicted arabinose efflux permease, MFS family [Paraburkholderia hospita]